jgi:hypothetical protein
MRIVVTTVPMVRTEKKNMYRNYDQKAKNLFVEG